jgi:hypothetical protein
MSIFASDFKFFRFSQVKSFDGDLIGKSVAGDPEKITIVERIISVEKIFFKKLLTEFPTASRSKKKPVKMCVIHPSVFICLTAATTQSCPA